MVIDFDGGGGCDGLLAVGLNWGDGRRGFGPERGEEGGAEEDVGEGPEKGFTGVCVHTMSFGSVTVNDVGWD